MYFVYFVVNNPSECAAAVLAAVLCDLTLYRGEGFAGLALLCLLAPAVLLLGASGSRLNRGSALAAGMLLLLSLRMVWQGSVLGAVAGFALIVACAMCLAAAALMKSDAAKAC